VKYISNDQLETVMHTVSVAQAKAQLSALLDAVQAGEVVVITRRGRPVARLQPERPAKPDFSVFRRLRGAWKRDMRIDREELHERG
jgi:prevent-host-death family protein